MELTLAKARSIMDTLPIGYYTGQTDLRCELSESEIGSYYNPAENTITISYPQCVEACQFVTDNEEDFETFVRSIFYHEISHALLTPRSLMNCVCDDEQKQVINTFEDERIETLLDNYYMGTNFKKNKFTVNGYQDASEVKPEDFKEPLQRFYATVRFRIGEQQYLDKVSNIITQRKEINNRTDNYQTSRYFWNVMRLYRDMCQNPPTQQQMEQMAEQMKQAIVDAMGNQNANGEQQAEVSDCGERASNPQQSEKGQEGEGENAEKEEKEGGGEYTEEKGHGRSEQKQLLENACQLSDIDSKILDTIRQIFAEFNTRVQNNTGSASIGYSGIINPRLCDREDYRFFVKRTSKNGMNGFSKFNLNLFCDDSGSFDKDAKIANSIIRALIQMEKENPDFSFTLIRCGFGQTICEKGKRYIYADGGTDLTDDIYTQFPQVQKRGYVNYNILLYDGDAYHGSGKEFSAFNQNNVTIISDADNRDPIEKFCPNAKQIIVTGNYAAQLFDNVVNTLKTALR